ncbi:hypothetical protein PAAG_01351 [Paracoccidioides lutzii Pb01]|uniref:RRM domain-containing protein n=1 Tax=Paracoccidioides lutzii (strain ATCC MYA-826 / Pb01) TaxID=502779 RepID=C1GS56_PARBA|nr:hypothetical protein PAAG_01351 [Paracoccidioides lutzii Pb01]EEH38889.1 hypothetical protein PAAG_01351 [Paracoccidioides lutzii Pb01]
MTSTGTTRLHISPLTPELLQAIFPPSVREAAMDVSYHSVQTFPENSYGFVNLPKMEAEKIVKKLNGSILKGKRLKIQEARPSKRLLPDDEAPLPGSSSPLSKPAKSLKKRRGWDNVVDGYELPQERRVKRGWTEPAGRDKRSRKSDRKDEKRKPQRSKYTEKSECLFRTSVPPNRTDAIKEKKKSSEKRRKDKKGGEVIVHEFEKSTTIPSFLRTGEKPAEDGLTSEYLDGKGWVDRNGNVKEKFIITENAVTNLPLKKSEQMRKNKNSTNFSVEKVAPQESSPTEVDSDETSSSGSSIETSSDDEDDDASSSGTSSGGDDSTSSSSSSDEGEENQDDYEKGERVEAPDLTPKATAKPSIVVTPSPNKPAVPKTIAREVKSPLQNSNPQQSPESATEVHPLEALFKSPANRRQSNNLKPPLEINTQFSFFGDDDNNIEEGDPDTAVAGNQPTHSFLNTGEPQTPFTKLDLMSRGVRSAAPTPDTVAPNKSRFWSDNEEEDDGNEDNCDDDDDIGDGIDIDDYPNRDGDDVVGTPTKPPATAGADDNAAKEGKEESEFSKWFWENRGENNRAWKRRRREAAKGKRQRENRQKGFTGK